MKIYNNPNITKINQVYNRNKPVGKTTSLSTAGDQIQISSKAKDFQVAMKAFKDLPETREEKIARIKAQIEDNSYNVSGKQVAKKIIDSILMDTEI